MICPGSPHYSQGVEDPESDFTLSGQLAHSVAEACLWDNIEPWHMAGQTHQKHGVQISVDAEMINAVQFYISELETWHGPNETWPWFSDDLSVERKFYCPQIHPYFYGVNDFGLCLRKIRTLHIWDYKHGAGIVVEIKRNAQTMYYACGFLESNNLWNKVDRVVMHVIQPRAYHADGPHRVWECSTEELEDWLWDELVPAMDKAMVSRDTVSGEHCRFCPARFVQCPALMKDMTEFQELLLMADEKGPDKLTNEQLNRLVELEVVAKIVMKAARKTVHARLANGGQFSNVKLVKARVHRKFKRGALEAAKKKFGRRCMTTSELKTPAQIEALPGGKDFAARWAFKPKGGTTIALKSDPRKELDRDMRKLFTPVSERKKHG